MKRWRDWAAGRIGINLNLLMVKMAKIIVYGLNVVLKVVKICLEFLISICTLWQLIFTGIAVDLNVLNKPFLWMHF